MTLIKWKSRQPSISEFDNMINNIFNDGWNVESYKSEKQPAVDIIEDSSKFELKADFPGYEKKDIKLTVENNVLKISARNDEEDQKTNYTLKERQSYQVERCFTLPESVISKKISARFKNGMLLLNIPKAEDKKEAVNNIKIN
jgi:HSP20 family protein